MSDKLQSMPLENLFAHPDNPNHMGSDKFNKLVRNIKATGKYEPVIVRPHPEKAGRFQIINGHHRIRALAKLGRKNAHCIVWDVDDEQTDILLVTLNRLAGSDKVDKKLALLKRLNRRIEADKLSRILPQTAKQIEQLVNLKRPARPVIPTTPLALAEVFFLDSDQQQIVENALTRAQPKEKKISAATRKAVALTLIAQHYLGPAGANDVPKAIAEQ